MKSEAGKQDSELDMLVIQFGDRTVKGFAEHSQWPPAEELDFHVAPPSFRRLGSDAVEPIPIEGVKAIFFVKSFEGKQHDDLRFYDDREPMDCLWVRVTFHDHEVIEGIIRNDSSFVFNSCFLMSPVDPEGNNWLICVIKKQLRNFQVLGLRPAPKHLRDLVHRPLVTGSI